MTCSAHRSPPKGTGVRVNGIAIPRDVIAREVQHHPSRTPAASWRAAARALVVRELLLQEARRLAVEAEPLADADGRRETAEEAAVRALVAQEVHTPSADMATCRRYYEQNPRAFRSPAIFEVAHILFAACRDDATGFARTEAAARAVLDVLKREPGRFAEMAKVHSACPSAEHGGNLGQVTAGQTTPEFEAALPAIPLGAVASDVVATPYGLHIIRLDRKIEERTLPFELVAERIANYLRESVLRRATAQYIARLVSRADIRGVTLEGAEAHRVS